MSTVMHRKTDLWTTEFYWRLSSTYNRCFVAGPGGGEVSYNPGQVLNVALECGDFVSRPNKVQAEEEEERALPVTRGRTEAERIHFLFRFRHYSKRKRLATNCTVWWGPVRSNCVQNNSPWKRVLFYRFLCYIGLLIFPGSGQKRTTSCADTGNTGLGSQNSGWRVAPIGPRLPFTNIKHW